MWTPTLMCLMALRSQWAVQHLVEVDTCLDLHQGVLKGQSQFKAEGQELQSHLTPIHNSKAHQNSSLPSLLQETCGLLQ